MKFKFMLRPELPPLAWAIIKANNVSTVEVIHGRAVECRDAFFIAGVWESDFSEGKIDEAYALQGSGAKMNDDGSCLTICASSNAQDALYSIQREHDTIVSNSIAFILAITGLKVDPDYYEYEYILNSSFFGIENYIKVFPLNESGIKIWRRCHILLIDNVLKKGGGYPESPLFKSFGDYRRIMLRTIRGLIENGQSSLRYRTYGAVTTISRGYDAACASALVHEVGCNTALTFSTPQKYVSDSGVDIAKIIGFGNIIEGNGNGYLCNDSYLEAESAAGGDVGCLVSFGIFKESYKDCLLFLGLKGDCIWDKNASYANSDFNYVHMSVAAEQNPEHFLNCNTVAISIPLILGDRWEDIYKLSNSSEMEPFSVGGDYDRPVPRRIIEMCGVPRESFGFKKMGAGFTLRFEPTLRAARKKMSPKSYKSLKLFCRCRKFNRIKYLRAVIRYFIASYPIYVAYIARVLHLPYKMKDVTYTPSPISELMIQWGLDMMRHRYIKAISD